MSRSGFIVNLTHDIDFIRKTYQYVTHDLVKLNFANLFRRFGKEEPFWTFETIMKVEEKAGCRSTYFFLQESIPWQFHKVGKWNLTLGKYKFSDPPVSGIIRELHSNGWEIALHGSYNSFRNKELLSQEKKDLENVLGAEVYGVRQHFLNLHIPFTWHLQRETGFVYDASLGRRQGVGFYQNHYGPVRHRESGMLIIPLTIMDSYLNRATGGNLTKAWPLLLKIIDEAEQNNAVLSVLWHNNYFNEKEHPGYSTLYTKLLWECRNRGAEFLTSYEIYQRFGSHVHNKVFSETEGTSDSDSI